MIKTEWLAKRFLGGNLYDCVCVFSEGTDAWIRPLPPPAHHALATAAEPPPSVAA